MNNCVHFLGLTIVILSMADVPTLERRTFWPMSDGTSQTLLNATGSGFITTKSSGSPLQDAIPKEVSMQKIPGSAPSRAMIIVQGTATKDMGFRRLEGIGRWPVLIFAVFGYVIVASLKKPHQGAEVPFVGAAVASLVGALLLTLVFPIWRNNISLHVDNALDHAVTVQVGTHHPLTIGGHSQMTVGLRRTLYDVVTRDAGTDGGQPIESFSVDLNVSKPQDSESYLVYNVLGRNTYTLSGAYYN